MTRRSLVGPAATGCIFLCIGMLNAAASSLEPAPVAPLPAVTPELLTSLRAPARIEKVDYQLVETERGPMPVSDGLSTHHSAIRALRAAFPVPLCKEFVYGDQEIRDRKATLRFPFAVEANERLVDALDKLEEISDGLVRWMLLHERIVLTATGPVRRDEFHVMDWPLEVDIEADTLLEALEQVEAAFNKTYPDSPPLIVHSHYVQLDLQGRPEGSGQTGKFLLRTESTLREAVLSLLDQMQDPAVCYGFFASWDLQGRWHFVLRLRKDDAPQWNTYANDEGVIHDQLLQRAKERLEGYFSRAEEATAAANAKPEDAQ